MKMGSLWVQIDNFTAYKTAIIITVTMSFQQSFPGLLNILHQAVHSDCNAINYMLWLVRTIITSHHPPNSLCTAVMFSSFKILVYALLVKCIPSTFLISKTYSIYISY